MPALSDLERPKLKLLTFNRAARALILQCGLHELWVNPVFL